MQWSKGTEPCIHLARGEKDVQQQCWLPQGIVSAHTLPKVGHMGMWEKPELALAMMKNMVDIVNNI